MAMVIVIPFAKPVYVLMSSTDRVLPSNFKLEKK